MGAPAALSRKLNRTLQTGIEHQMAGRLAEAEECYYRVLEFDSRYADALHLLGVVAQQRGNYRESVRLIKAAIHQNATISMYHGNLGNTLQLQGALDDSISCYRRALSLDPGNHGYRHSLACVLLRRGDLAEARDAFHFLLNARPDFAEAHYNLGTLEAKIGQHREAIECFQRANALQPNCSDFHLSLADSQFATGNFAVAANSYNEALRLAPQSTSIHPRLGAALKQCGNLTGAAEAFRVALQHNSNDAASLSMLGATLTESGDLQGAAQSLKRSLDLEPNSPDALCNLGKLYFTLGDLHSAMQCTRKALEIQPTHGFSLCDLGFQLELLGDLTASIQCYEIALTSEPDFAWARFQLGVAQLASGIFSDGWKNYEARWKTPQFVSSARTLSQPQWKGEDLHGMRIFVYAEQGLGDTIQFARYIPMLKSCGAEVLLEVQPGLRRLLQNLDGANKIVVRGEEVPPFDFQCPLMSLPLGFGTELESIPANVPYLKVPEEAVRQWSGRLDSNKFRVGIVWSGNPKHTRERFRSIPLSTLAQLSRTAGTAFYSLQKGPGTSQLGTLDPGLCVIDLDAEQMDFSDTAAIVANLDLVITIDTSVAHLAGAMGKPVWILLNSAPDWRWLKRGEGSAWYPSARLYRQTMAGSWDDVIARVQRDLLTLLGNTVEPIFSYPAEDPVQSASERERSLTSIVELLTSTSTEGTLNAMHPDQSR